MSLHRPMVAGLCVAGFVGLGVIGWRFNAPPSPSPAPALAPVSGVQAAALPSSSPSSSSPSAQQAARVEVAAVTMRNIVDDVSAVGTLVSNESVILRPEVAGRVAAIRFRDGSAVRRGEVLVELDAAVQSAELQQAKAELELAEANARRVEDLFKQQFVSRSARDEAASRQDVARANAALVRARLARTRIRAPFDGIVGIRKINVGDYVRDGDALINIEDIAVLKLDFRLPEIYLGRLSAGQTLEVSSDVTPGVVFPAVVEAIDPLVDADGRAVLLRARLTNSEGRLRPGVFARVRLMMAQREGVILIPETALIPASGQSQSVFRIENGRARRIEVKTGQRRAREIEVIEGLAPGDQVVIAGQLKLRDGAAVTVAQTAPPAAGN